MCGRIGAEGESEVVKILDQSEIYQEKIQKMRILRDANLL